MTRKPYVVLTSPRSGSTWLISILNQLPGCTAYGELFLSRKRKPNGTTWDDEFYYPRFIEVFPQNKLMRPLQVFQYLNRLYREKGAVGFKLMYAHLAKFPELMLYLRLQKVHVIHLVRRNSLDVVISQAINRKVHKAHRLSGEGPTDPIQVDLKLENLVRRLDRKQKKALLVRNAIRRAGLPVLEIAYEDLVENPSSLKSICEFLSLPQPQVLPESKFVKNRQKSQADVVRNYAEVQAVLSGTPYIEWLEKNEGQPF